MDANAYPCDSLVVAAVADFVQHQQNGELTSSGREWEAGAGRRPGEWSEERGGRRL